MSLKSLLLVVSLFGINTLVSAQTAINPNRVITTAVPFLNINPESRAGGMGDAGVATSANASSLYWNPGKAVFINESYGGSISYSPWLRKLVGDMSLSYLTGYYKRKKEELIGISLNYFDYGSINFTDQTGNQYYTGHPREYALSLSYARQLSKKIGLGLSVRYINSNLNTGIADGSGRPGRTMAADLGFYYTTPLDIKGTKNNLSFGAAITNVGGKIYYVSNDNKSFIPTNLRIGTAFTHELDLYNKLTFALDFNKLLVPTPPLYVQNADGTVTIAKGQDNSDAGVVEGVVKSFDGFSLEQIQTAAGLEYVYNNIFSLRTGYHYEAPSQGNRTFYTVGVGLKYQTIDFDFAYLISSKRQNPLGETLRFTIALNIKKKVTTDEDTISE